MQYRHHNGRGPCHPAGESRNSHLRVDFDRRLKLEFHGSKVTLDAGFLAYRELDDALGLTEVAGGLFQDSRTGKNGRHGMVGQLRQSVFGRLGGYDDVNDADRLGGDPSLGPGIVVHLNCLRPEMQGSRRSAIDGLGRRCL